MSLQSLSAYPLGLRSEGIVRFSTAPFILLRDLSKVSFPGSDCVVKEIGSYTVFDAAKVTRAYLTSSVGREGILEVLEALDQTECYFYLVLDTIIPESEEDLQFWTGASNGLIGNTDFLIEAGTPQEVRYLRSWNPHNPNHIEPVLVTEKLSQTSWPKKHHLMQYFRTLKGAGTPQQEDEFLYLDQTFSADNVPQIQILVGIRLLKSHIKVL